MFRYYSGAKYNDTTLTGVAKIIYKCIINSYVSWPGRCLETGPKTSKSIWQPCSHQLTMYYGLWHVQIFALWAVSPKITGGLSFTTTDVGNILAISGMRSGISLLMLGMPKFIWWLNNHVYFIFIVSKLNSCCSNGNNFIENSCSLNYVVLLLLWLGRCGLSALPTFGLPSHCQILGSYSHHTVVCGKPPPTFVINFEIYMICQSGFKCLFNLHFISHYLCDNLCWIHYLRYLDHRPSLILENALK